MINSPFPKGLRTYPRTGNGVGIRPRHTRHTYCTAHHIHTIRRRRKAVHSLGIKSNISSLRYRKPVIIICPCTTTIIKFIFVFSRFYVSGKRIDTTNWSIAELQSCTITPIIHIARQIQTIHFTQCRVSQRYGVVRNNAICVHRPNLQCMCSTLIHIR